MQAGSSKLLYGFHVLATRNLQLYFHTSACALKGFPPRGKNKSWKARGDGPLKRVPARKRLAPTLKPAGTSGTYEVAPRRSKSRDENTRERGKKTAAARTDTEPPSRESREASSSPKGKFERDRAPHEGRSSWHKPISRNPGPLRRERAFDRERGSDRRKFPLSGSYDRDSRRVEGFRPRDVSFRDPASSDRERFMDRMSSEKQSWPDRSMSASRTRPDRPEPRPSKSDYPGEFDATTVAEPLKTLPDRFTSPPLLDGLLQSVRDVLGENTKPSPIQSLSLKHLFTPPSHVTPAHQDEHRNTSLPTYTWSQYLLASETGSGKSIAYLLPMIQYLKLTESSPATLPPSAPPLSHRSVALNPRGLILAPTHELSRQLSSFAKALLHNVRLRVLCASRANNSSSSRGKSSTASQLKRELDDTNFGMTDGAHVGGKTRPVDVLVGTPTKILEMVRGWGWNKEGKIEEQWDDARKERARRWVPGPPETGLAGIDYVVVDEADILFDKDFQESTRMLLADISHARGYDHPSFSGLAPSTSSLDPPSPVSEPIAYPFHLLLTSATIPSALANYLTDMHPGLTRLASPKLHQLPTTLKTEHCAWTSGNKNSDIEKRIRRVWGEDASTRSKAKSKILIFCNKSSKVEDLGLYLTEKGVPNVALTSTAEARLRGSNRHLAGFLKPPTVASPAISDSAVTANQEPHLSTSPSDPHVLITTSLLSRGLDFSPQISHVFIVDEPRNMIDFLHRAGRSGRAGHEGKVVVFGKMKGRGSGNAREVKRKIGALGH